MSPRSNPSDKIPVIVAEWRTGEYTQRELARRHKVSTGFVAKHTKGVAQDTAEIVSNIVDSKQRLSELDEQAVSAVSAAVDERTKHIQFFTNAAVLNVKEAIRKINHDMTQMDHNKLADTILKGKETVLGKTPDTAIQINNGNSAGNYSEEHLNAISERVALITSKLDDEY